MKTQIIIILIFLIHDVLSAQEIISTSGDFFENDYISVSQTVGEPVIETLSTGNNLLTQGFQQSNLIVTGLNNFPENIKVQIYPNPTTEFIYVSIETHNNVFYKLYDVDGKLLQTMKMYKPETKTIKKLKKNMVKFYRYNVTSDYHFSFFLGIGSVIIEQSNVKDIKHNLGKPDKDYLNSRDKRIFFYERYGFVSKFLTYLTKKEPYCNVYYH